MIPDTLAAPSILQRRAEMLFAGLFLLYPIGMASIRHYSSSLMALMVVVGIFLAFMGRKKPSREQFIIIYGILPLIGAGLLSFINAENMDIGLNRLEKLIDLLCLLPLFYGAANCRYDLRRKFLTGLLIAAPVNLGIAGYSLWVEGLPRAKGYYNPIIFGDLMMLAAMLLLVWLVVSTLQGTDLKSLWIWLAIFVFLLTSFASGTRGALLAVPPVLLWLFWCCRQQLSRQYLARLAMPLVGLVLGALVLGSIYGGQSGALQRVSSSTFASFADSQRAEMWRLTLRLFDRHPLIGTGLGDFYPEVVRAKQMGLVELDYDFSHAHNIYLDLLGTTGLFGFGAMLLALFIIPGLMLLRTERNAMEPDLCKLQIVAPVTVLICFAAFGLTEHWLARSSMVLSFVAGLVAFYPQGSVQEKMT